MKRKLVVSPDFMSNHGTPHSPKDLIQWDWIGLKMRANTKTLINPSGKTFLIDFEPRIIADSVDAVCQLAIAGLGLATPPAFLVAEDIDQGCLVDPFLFMLCGHPTQLKNL